MDFNTAEPQQEYTLIPDGTMAKARLSIKKSYGGYVTESKCSDSKYLDCCFEILEGVYKKRSVFSKIGIDGSDTFVNLGKSRIRAILESARCISSRDSSEKAVNARKINSYSELDGLEVAIKIKIKTDKNGRYDDLNDISKVFTAECKEYAEIMCESNCTTFSNGEIPF